MRILVCSNDQLGSRMAGPAIRALEIGKFLRSHTTHSISLLGPGEEPTSLPHGIQWFQMGSWLNTFNLFRQHQIIIAPSFKLVHLLFLYWMKRTVILDGYDPVPLEILEQHKDAKKYKKHFLQFFHTQVLNLALRRADVLLCASERQRSWYIGLWSALGKIDPETYAADPQLAHSLKIIPFGLQTNPPVHHQQVMKGIIPGIDTDSVVLLWGGGIWNWFDPVTLIRSVHTVSQEFPQLKLFFLGVQHPNPRVPFMRRCAEAMKLAKDLGAEGKSIFFNEGWIPFEEREDFLLESDLGVSIHFDHLESEFSFRTRMLDYVWAELPLIVSDGDVWSKVTRTENIGWVVQAQDEKGLSAAIHEALSQPEKIKSMKEKLHQIKKQYTWDHVLEPLLASVKTVRRRKIKLYTRLSGSIKILGLSLWSLIHMSLFK